MIFMINENVQKLKNTIRAGRAMHAYLVTSADCDETAPEGEPSSTAELLRQCAALLLFGSEKRRCWNSLRIFTS